MAESKQRSGSVIGDLAALLESGYDSDVTLVAGDARIEAHRLILSARSPVFAAILRRHQQEACLEIPDTEKDVLRQLLRFIYTDEAPELARMAPQLLVAADKYDLQVLKDRCEQQLVRDICVENAAAGAVLAVQRGCPALRRAVVDFIRSHSVSVMGTPGWADALHSHSKALAQVSRLVAGPAQTESRPPLQHAGSSQEIYKAPRGPEDLASRRVLGVVRSKAPLDATQTPDNSSSREKSESSSADSSDVTDWFAMRMAKASGPKPSSLSPHTHTLSGESKFSGKPPTTEDRPETNNKSKLGAKTHQTPTNDYPWWYVPQTYNPESSAHVKSTKLPPKSLSKPKESLVSRKSISVQDLISNDELPWWRDVL